MIKAIFLDYTGTIVKEVNEDIIKIGDIIVSNSDLKDKKEITKLWGEYLSYIEKDSFSDNFISEDEIILKILDLFKKNHKLNYDHRILQKLNISHWMNAPIYEDVLDFFNKSKYPIYVISNNEEKYIKYLLGNNKINYTNIISGEMVKAYKPRKEIFNYALKISGCNKDEVIHIGDSFKNDYQASTDYGIKALLLDRYNRNKDITINKVNNLYEALEYIDGIN